jgi:PAS domain S-box-containing protein/putative nucleotidyltransferase with HDIG domain
MDTEREEKTEELWHPDIRMNPQVLLSLIKSSPLGIVALDINGTIRIWNKAAEGLSGWREDEVLGQSIRVLFGDGWEPYEELRKRTLRREAFNLLPMAFARKDGSIIQISYSTAPVLDAESRVIGTIAIVYDITEKMALEMALRESLEKMNRVFDETVDALAAAIEKRDPYTAGHQQRVAQLACDIAVEMGDFDDYRMKGIRTATMIHDIGKLYVPSELLSKAGQLTGIEFELIKTHPQAGYEILQNIEFPWPVARIIQQHHERLDGSGYPTGLAGDDILLEARIVGVADVVEAMSSHRPYRPGRGMEPALHEIRSARGSIYDSRVVDACLALFRNGYVLPDR